MGLAFLMMGHSGRYLYPTIKRIMDNISVSHTADVAIENGSKAYAGATWKQLLDKVSHKNAVIGVVGLGYVGLPLAVAYAKKNFKTIGVDLSQDKVDQLNTGSTYIQDVEEQELADTVRSGHLSATSDFSALGDADIVFICVPTPVTYHKDPDTRYIDSATRSIAEYLREGQLIVLKSTTFPNTTEELVQPILEEAAAREGYASWEKIIFLLLAQNAWILAIRFILLKIRLLLLEELRKRVRK